MRRADGRLVVAVRDGHGRRQVFGHGVLEFFDGVRVGRGPLAVVNTGFRWTGRQRRLTRRRSRTETGEMLFSAHRLLFRTTATAVLLVAGLQ